MGGSRCPIPWDDAMGTVKGAENLQVLYGFSYVPA